MIRLSLDPAPATRGHAQQVRRAQLCARGLHSSVAVGSDHHIVFHDVSMGLSIQTEFYHMTDDPLKIDTQGGCRMIINAGVWIFTVDPLASHKTFRKPIAPAWRRGFV